jgi:hypothetical protein
MDGFVCVVLASVLAALVVTPLGTDPRPPPRRPPGKVAKKGGAPLAPSPPLLATLVDVHSPVRLALDDEAPPPARFDQLLHDPVLGQSHSIDPAILRLVRTLARSHPLARIEVVSGFRSPKLNETLRKKGHHVASHSQHSLGHAMDLRVVPDGESAPIPPRALAALVRGAGWTGGVGMYEGKDDRFVHVDTGPLRTWYGQ